MKTHPLQVGYLVIGLIFLGLAATWTLDWAGVIDNPDPGVVFPITLVVAGAIGLLASAKRLFAPASASAGNAAPITGDNTPDNISDNKESQ